MSNDFKLYSAHTFTTLDVTKGMVRSRYGVDGYPREHYVLGRDISKIVAALLDIPVIKPMDKTRSSNEQVPVKNVGGVDVSENTDPQRMRRMAVNYLVAAETAEKMIRSAEYRKKGQEAAEAARVELEKGKKFKEQNQCARELFDKPYSTLATLDRVYVNKYLALAEELEAMKAAVKL